MRPPGTAAVPGAAAAILGGALLSMSCGGPPWRDVRATILTESGAPIAGAVFYAEAWDDDGPFAFLTMTSGTAGEVPQSAREASRIDWRPGARVAVAAFAEGYAPTVLRDPDGAVRTDGALLILRPVPAGGGWDPALAAFAFPFPETPALAERAGAPEAAALRAAFRSAWAARDPREPLSEAEKRKLSLLGAND